MKIRLSWRFNLYVFDILPIRSTEQSKWIKLPFHTRACWPFQNTFTGLTWTMGKAPDLPCKRVHDPPCNPSTRQCNSQVNFFFSFGPCWCKFHKGGVTKQAVFQSPRNKTIIHDAVWCMLLPFSESPATVLIGHETCDCLLGCLMSMDGHTYLSQPTKPKLFFFSCMPNHPL